MATFALLILGSRQLALAGEVCLAFLSRELKEEEKVASVVGVAYALDAIAVIVHKDNPVLDPYLVPRASLWYNRINPWSARSDPRRAVLEHPWSAAASRR
jgi:ABC-type phosphate transport system substrate-binding protein